MSKSNSLLQNKFKKVQKQLFTLLYTRLAIFEKVEGMGRSLFLNASQSLSKERREN